MPTKLDIDRELQKLALAPSFDDAMHVLENVFDESSPYNYHSRRVRESADVSQPDVDAVTTQVASCLERTAFTVVEYEAQPAHSALPRKQVEAIDFMLRNVGVGALQVSSNSDLDQMFWAFFDRTGPTLRIPSLSLDDLHGPGFETASLCSCASPVVLALEHTTESGKRSVVRHIGCGHVRFAANERTEVRTQPTGDMQLFSVDVSVDLPAYNALLLKHHPAVAEHLIGVYRAFQREHVAELAVRKNGEVASVMPFS